MPIHDWTRVDAGTFRDFRLDWMIQIRRTLNASLLPSGYFAMKADSISIRNRLGRVVAIIEILSPGTKESKHAFRSFVTKVVEFLRQGIHVQLVDLFPPTPRDPAGIHHAIWAELTETPLEPRPEDKPLTAACYDAGDVLTSYFEPLAVGDDLPDAPLFLEPGIYIPMPLEATYDTSWTVLPEVIRESVSPVR